MPSQQFGCIKVRNATVRMEGGNYTSGVTGDDLNTQLVPNLDSTAEPGILFLRAALTEQEIRPESTTVQSDESPRILVQGVYGRLNVSMASQ